MIELLGYIAVISFTLLMLFIVVVSYCQDISKGEDKHEKG
jgi:hypothetical protein